MTAAIIAASGGGPTSVRSPRSPGSLVPTAAGATPELGSAPKAPSPGPPATPDGGRSVSPFSVAAASPTDGRWAPLAREGVEGGHIRGYRGPDRTA